MANGDVRFRDTESLEAIGLFVSLKNNTSRTELKASEARKHRRSIKKNHKFEHGRVDLIQFLNQGIVLEVPPRTCAHGHDLTVTIETRGTDSTTYFEASAKVDQLTNLTDQRDLIMLSFIQFEGTQWQRLNEAYDQMQSQIDLLLERMKG